MNGNDILKAMNGIDERFIREAERLEAPESRITAEAEHITADNGKPVRVRRSGAVLAAGLAVVIAAGGIFAAVKYANRGVPEDISPAGQTANGFQPMTAENDYVRLTLNNIESDGHIAVFSFDLDKLYDEDDPDNRQLDFHVNSLYHGMFDAHAKDGKGDAFMVNTTSKGTNGDDVDKFSSFMVFDQPADKREFELNVFLSSYSTAIDCESLIKDISFDITVTKNKDCCTLKAADGRAVTVSELGMTADHETTVGIEKEMDEKTYKAAYPESITDKNGTVYKTPLESAEFFRLGHDTDDATYALIGKPSVPAKDIAELTVDGEVYKAEEYSAPDPDNSRTPGPEYAAKTVDLSEPINLGYSGQNGFLLKSVELEPSKELTEPVSAKNSHLEFTVVSYLSDGLFARIDCAVKPLDDKGREFVSDDTAYIIVSPSYADDASNTVLSGTGGGSNGYDPETDLLTWNLGLITGDLDSSRKIRLKASPRQNQQSDDNAKLFEGLEVEINPVKNLAVKKMADQNGNEITVSSLGVTWFNGAAEAEDVEKRPEYSTYSFVCSSGETTETAEFIGANQNTEALDDGSGKYRLLINRTFSQNGQNNLSDITGVIIDGVLYSELVNE